MTQIWDNKASLLFINRLAKQHLMIKGGGLHGEGVDPNSKYASAPDCSRWSSIIIQLKVSR
jgi:hypothetical protein